MHRVAAVGLADKLFAQASLAERPFLVESTAIRLHFKVSRVSCVFPGLVSNYTFQWSCSVSVEGTSGASNRRLPLSRCSVISLIPLPTVLMCQTFALLEGRNFALKPSVFFFSLLPPKTAFSSWFKAKMGKEKKGQLFYACSPLKASAEICLIIHPASSHHWLT